jgi:hypothetical protein
MTAAPGSVQAAPRHVTGVVKFERLFRVAASLDVDNQDLKRYSDFIIAKSNGILN